MASITISNRTITGFLIDLDGVLYIGDKPLAGAIDVVKRLVQLKVPFRYITNTTRMSKQTLMEHIRSMGFPVMDDWVFSAPIATYQFLKNNRAKGIYLIVGGDVVNDFSDLPIRDDEVDFVVMGDPGEDVNYDLLNKGFQHLMKGSELIAMQKNRFWKTEKGYVMDAGAFVAALEFASGKTARIMGKPSRDFFSLALNSLNFPPEHVAMIGDDVESDILGAYQCGLSTILVKTGKYRSGDESKLKFKPDLIIETLSDLLPSLK